MRAACETTWSFWSSWSSWSSKHLLGSFILPRDGNSLFGYLNTDVRCVWVEAAFILTRDTATDSHGGKLFPPQCQGGSSSLLSLEGNGSQLEVPDVMLIDSSNANLAVESAPALRVEKQSLRRLVLLSDAAGRRCRCFLEPTSSVSHAMCIRNKTP